MPSTMPGGHIPVKSGTISASAPVAPRGGGSFDWSSGRSAAAGGSGPGRVGAQRAGAAAVAPLLAGPGFPNFVPVQVELSSAAPTGPIPVTHGRGEPGRPR